MSMTNQTTAEFPLDTQDLALGRHRLVITSLLLQHYEFRGEPRRQGTRFALLGRVLESEAHAAGAAVALSHFAPEQDRVDELGEVYSMATIAGEYAYARVKAFAEAALAGYQSASSSPDDEPTITGLLSELEAQNHRHIVDVVVSEHVLHQSRSPKVMKDLKWFPVPHRVRGGRAELITKLEQAVAL